LEKELARKTFLRKRLDLSLNEFRLLSARLIINVIELIEEQKPKCIHCFLPIDSKTEIDTNGIIEYCWDNGIKVVVPVSDFKTSTMKSALYTKATTIKIAQYDIPEPDNPEWVNDSEIDMVITPLLAFDQKGFRVGYGKGFYDRFFSSFKSEVSKVGISLFEATEDINCDEFDIKLNYCATPKNIYTF